MSQFLGDVRIALRGFRKAPVFTGVAVVSLALGIGANTAIFSLVDQLLLRLMPVKNPQELVMLHMQGRHYGGNMGNWPLLSYPMYKDFSEHNTAFSGMACRAPRSTSLGYGGHTEIAQMELVSGTYFPVLGVTAALGRTLTPEDDRVLNGAPYVVLSHSFWQARFGGDLSIVGKTLVVEGHDMQCVGVAQAGFEGTDVGSKVQLFVPIVMKPRFEPSWLDLKNRRMRWVTVFGRLKPGLTVAQAKASLQPYMHGLLESEVREPEFRNASEFDRREFLKCWMDLDPGGRGNSFLREEMAKPLWLLMGVTGMVLLLACANLANLLVARATGRQREFAIRLAIGAGRGRLIRQMLIESLLLSLAGAVAGVLLAFWAVKLLLRAYLAENHTALSSLPDWRILAFALTVALLTTILFGLLPALQASRPDVAPTLKDEAGSVVGGSHVLLRKVLVTIQVTLSLLLLIGAGLFVRTLGNLRNLGPGFSISRLVTFDVNPALVGYAGERSKQFYRDLADRIKAMPGVESNAFSAMRILDGDEWDQSVTVEGYTSKEGNAPDPHMNSISPDYFATLGIPVIDGRDFNQKDNRLIQHGEKPDDTQPAVVMINETFVRKYFPKLDPIGRHIGMGSDPGTKADMEVIGVVKDVKYENVRDEIPPQVFLPYLAGPGVSNMTVYVRTSSSPRQMMQSLRHEVASLDPSIPVENFRTEEEQVDASLRIERLVASLSSVFGFLATVLAVVGLYGVMAYTVSRRTREIGIRVALGAARSSVVRMVMREVLLLIGLGVVVGIPLAIGLSRLVQSQLYGLAPHDPTTITLATLLLATVAAAAGFIPAMRASRIDPMRALRYE